jgi:hypothetical protein
LNENEKSDEENKKEYICWKNYSKTAFQSELRKIDWARISELNLNEKAKTINECLSNTVNNLLVKKVINSRENNKWYDQELRKLKKEKNKCYDEIGKSTNWESYKKIRNLYKNSVRKKDHDSTRRDIEDNKDNPVQLWKKLKTLIDYKENKRTHVKFGSDYVYDKKEISKKFNEYFISSIKDINKCIPNVDESEFPVEQCTLLNELSSFKSVRKEDVLKIMNRMEKKSGIDNVNISVFRDAFDVIGDVFTDMMNEILLSGEFPEIYKISTVVPIEKVNKTIKCEEFRPINMLYIEEKIIEHLVKDQLLAFVDENNILCAEQSGFRASHSCESALNVIMNHWKEQLQLKKITIVTFLDLKRAFETIDRRILLKKLERYGIKGTVLRFFENYLKDRKQHCRFDGVCSEDEYNDLGVPQGTVIGPLLFILYINDIIKNVKFSKVSLFADDTLLSISGDNVEEVMRNMNKDLQLLSKWLNYNKLKLNVEKTKFMVITNKRIVKNEVSLNINDQPIERVIKMKYLGMMLDDALKLDDHVDYICKKMGRKYGFMCRANGKLTTESKILLFKSIVSPHVDYCSSLLYLITDEQMKRLQKIQNKIMRLILHCNKRTHISWMLDTLKWQSMKQRIEFNTMIFIFKIVHNMAPENLCNNISYVRDSHQHDTRSSNNICLPNMTMATSQNCIFYKGIKAYNNLSVEIKNSCTIKEFKRKLNDHLRLASNDL